MLAGEIIYLEYWWPGLPDWMRLTTTPPPVPLGIEFQLGCAYLNRSPGKVVGHVDLTLTEPNGTRVDLEATENQDGEADPGWGWRVRFSPIVLDQVGNYQGKFTLSLKESAETIQEQLASCWNYISGCGTRSDNHMVWAYRNGVALWYDSQDPIGTTLTGFMAGDGIWLYLTRDCTLTYEGRSWNLFLGWNGITW